MADLREVIEQLVAAGETDPHVAARKIREAHSSGWLGVQLLALSDELLAELVRRSLGRVRRSAELALRPGDVVSSAGVKVAKTFVPGKGWLVTSTLTAEDVDAKELMYRTLARTMSRRADWYRDVAAQMRFEGAATLGDLDVLPTLPEDDLPELAA